MSYSIKNRSGKVIANTDSRRYADAYAQQVGGSVSVARNPAATFGRQWGTATDRKNLFTQYKSTSSFVWARETIQNAVDNKATNITYATVNITEGKYKGCVLARISDNGTGMDLKTLQDKFLTIGGTGKGSRNEDTGSVGGFGEAKKVVLLSWQAWRVITKTADSQKAVIADAVNGWEEYNWDYIEPPNVIRSSGTIVEVISWPEYEYKIDTCDARTFIGYCDLPNVNFSVLEVTCNSGSLNNGSFAYSEKRENILSGILKTAQFRSPVSGYDTGEMFTIVDGFRNKIANFELGNSKCEFSAPVEDSKGNIVEKKCAKLYYRRFTKEQKKYNSPYIFFRVKGLFLWKKGLTTEVGGNIIIDFTVKTTLILSDNRDSIRNESLDKSIDEWINDLIKDPSQKLRGFSKTRTMVFQGSLGSLRAPSKPHAIATAQAIAHIQMASSGISDAKIDREIERIAEETSDRVLQIENSMQTESPIRIAPEVVREIIKYEAKSNKDQISLVKAIERALFVPEYVLHTEDDLAAQGFKIPEKFLPEKLTKDLKKILAVWAEMIRLVFMMKSSNMSYAVGFVFSEDALGLHASKGFFGANESTGAPGLDADGAILLNPFYFDKDNRKELIDVSNPEHLEAMWATCVHECTHMVDHCGYHDASFASCLTRNVGYVARVYPLVELISEIVQTAEPLARAKFAKGLDVEEYLSRDRKRGRKPKSSREKNLERFVAELASKLAMKGGALPSPEEFDVDMPPSVWNAVREVGAVIDAGQRGGAVMSELMIKSLRNKIKNLEEEISKKDKEDIPLLPAPRATDRSRLFRKFN